MRSFVELDRIIGTVPGAVVNRLRVVDTGRGTEALYRHQLPGVLDSLARRARVASVTASSEIEGIVVPDQIRAEQIIEGRATVLRTRSEQELAGYRDALDYLFQADWRPLNLFQADWRPLNLFQADWRPLNVGLLLHLHRLLFGRTQARGGAFKQHDNVVVDRHADGSVAVRFRPVPASDTAFAVAELVSRFHAGVAAGQHHPLLLIGLFALDLSVIHPFEDGNGRVTRVVTNALLADAGYGVVRYISLEQLIADAADAYYQSLLDSTHGWHDGKADPWPWLSYFVDTMARSYELFAVRAADRKPGTKQARVREYVLRHAPPVFRFADVRESLPGVSDQTIRIVLEQLRAEGVVSADGVGRAAVWARSRVGS